MHKPHFGVTAPQIRRTWEETKAAATVSARDFAGIDLLHDRLGDAFSHGVVLYLGDAIQSFGDRRTALPLGALWAG